MGATLLKHTQRNKVIIVSKVYSTKGVTSPIIGATKEKHLDEATTALDVELTGKKLAYLEELYVPHPIVANSSLFIVNYTGQTLRVFGSIEEATQRLLLLAIIRFRL